MSTILLVDDEPTVLSGQRNLLRLNGYSEIREATSIQSARMILEEEPVDLILLDLTLPEGSGQELLAEVRESHPSTAIVVVTGAADVPTAVECMRLGAYDFLVKGTDSNRIPSTVRNALSHRSALRENQLLREAVTRPGPRTPEAFEGFISHDPRIQRILVYLEALSSLPDPILVTGETGVGKELIARGVHRASGRSGAFVPVNMAGVDDHVFTDTLFGHKRGAFTGADGPRDGLVTAATDGTLFLDEIGDMPLESQARILRMLDSGEFLRLGSDRPEYSRARLVFATNRNLAESVSEGRFRRDLYYRIATHHAWIPPLRDRPDDVGPIVERLMREQAQRTGFDPLPVTGSLVRRLQTMQLNGNVRELQQIVLRALASKRWMVESDDDVFSAEVDPSELDSESIHFGETLPTPDKLIEVLLNEADRRHPDNRSDAAAAIGLSPQAFANRWKRLHSRPGR